jgi:hypothetical protein
LAGYDVLIVTAAIFALIYPRRKKRKGKERKGWKPEREESTSKKNQYNDASL